MLRETCISRMGGVEGLRVVVTRYYPRGVSRARFDRWIPALAPSRGLLSDWRRGLITWGEYAARFRREILGSPEALAALRRLVELGEARDVYLVCWERRPPCHRWLLLDLAGELSGASPAPRGEEGAG